MGKKRKQQFTGEGSRKQPPTTSEGSRKQPSTTSEGSRKQPEVSIAAQPEPEPSKPPLPKISYHEMPSNHKKKFFINDDVGGSVRKYIGMVSWLRVMGCFEGSVFEDIPNLKWGGESYPLVEVEVVTPENKSAKFLIAKSSLYVIGCVLRLLSFQFSCEFLIDSFVMLQDYDGSYRTKPWKKIGPKSMIDAINLLHEADANDLANVSVYVDAVEIFYVHICEAARLYVIESFVCTSLKPSGVGNFTQRIYEDEESFILPGDKNQTIESEFDVYSLVKGDGPIDFELSINPPNYIEFFIKKFKLLSKVWLTYSLSGRRVFEMKPEDVSKLHLRSKKSLRSCLAVLCNTNLDKILSEWQKKSKNNHATVTPAVFEEMVRLVRELQKQKKVLL